MSNKSDIITLIERELNEYRGKMYKATGNLEAKAKITKQYAEGIYLFLKSELIKDKDAPSCINEYRKWKRENPDEGYQYDEIHDFANGLSRGELQELLEYADKK
jgi:hypothetical protein